MNSHTITKGILRALGVVVGIVLLLYFLFKIQSVLIYIAIAAVISLIGRPIIVFLRRRLKLGITFSVILTMLIFVCLFAGLVALFIPLIAEQSKNLSLLNVDSLQYNIDYLYNEIVNYFHLKPIDVKQSIKDSGLLKKLDFSIIPNFVNTLVSGLGSFSVGLFSVLFISFFFLKDSKLLQAAIITTVPVKDESKTLVSLNKIKNLLSRYFLGLIFQILIIFVIYTIVLLIFGIENAIVIAFLCALLNLIPYIGPMISAVLMALLSMSSNLGESFSEVILPKTIYVMIGFAFAQLVDNFFSQPIIFSRSVKSHPLEIFLIIVIAGLLFGVVGMILAIPSYTAIKVILKEFLSDNKIVKKITKDL